MATIDDVRKFWNDNPLWTGEASVEQGSPEFFESHRVAYVDDGMAGVLDEEFFPDAGTRILDVGCGIGFWPVEFWQRGYRDITGVDISARSIELAKRRAEFYAVSATFVEGNAEDLPFADGEFGHVNCIGVVHHTVNPRAAVEEIHRVIKPGGTATIAVYYRNIILRNYQLFRPVSKFLGFIGAKLSGRGREGIYSELDVNQIVRMYDGADNPIGLAYDRSEFATLLGVGFSIDKVFYHFFPARSLPFPIPRALHRALDRLLPFMILARVTKR